MVSTAAAVLAGWSSWAAGQEVRGPDLDQVVKQVREQWAKNHPDRPMPALPEDLKQKIEEAKTAAKQFAEEQAALIKQFREAAKEEREKLREELKARLEEFREQQKEKIKEIKERLQELREKFREERQRMLDAAKERERERKGR
jgi:DNA anti-recombination protein RmuC